MKTTIVLLICLPGMVCAANAQVLVKKIFPDARKQVSLTLQEVNAARKNDSAIVAARSLENGEIKFVPSDDWTAGFFAGELWLLYKYSHESIWKNAAEKYTALMQREQWNGTTHDMGFKMYSSYGNGYLLTHDAAYKKIIIQSARTLCTRFNPKVGCIRSWDHTKKWQYPVIIDNMMNLELLFAATQLTGDSSFYHIAVTHANTTMKNHYRSDYSCYHVLDYDTTTGAVLHKTTAQGYSDASAWARGQSWGLYGFMMCYRFTKDPRYLQQAEHIAAFILKNPHLPKDRVPYWDYDAPNIPNEPRDASAAAIMASALYELASYSKNREQYLSAADEIMTSLTNHYRSPVGENKGFILLHSTGSKPDNSEIDVPIIYADYYYLEALLRKNTIEK